VFFFLLMIIVPS